MTTMGGKAFVDTNVLLRAMHIDIPLHTEADELITSTRRNGSELWISQQVIREYIVQVSRPGMLASVMVAREIAAQVKTLRTVFKVASESDAVTDKLLELIEEFPTAGKQIHDANIVATMLVYGIDTLLTINLADMKRFASKINILSPKPQI